jgi:DNA polymerase-3 subunit alpha (Gram-positive type)
VNDVDNDSLLNLTLDECPLVFLDIETTGLDYSKDHIIEVAAVSVKGGVEVSSWSTLIKPVLRQGLFAEMVAIPKEITKITGIEGSHLTEQPVFEEIHETLAKHLAGGVLVAHNAAFDVSFLAFKIQSMGLSLPAIPVLDTLALSRAVSPELKSHSLTALKGFYGVKAEKSHRALDDTRATVQVFDKILDLAVRRRFPGQASDGARSRFRLKDMQEQFKALRAFVPDPAQLPSNRSSGRRG